MSTPAADTIPTPILESPPAGYTRPLPRAGHTAVWTNSEMIVWGGFVLNSNLGLNTGGSYCAQPPRPPITIIQPNGGEVWTAGSVHQITWDGHLSHIDHLIIQYTRDGGASWFRV